MHRQPMSPTDFSTFVYFATVIIPEAICGLIAFVLIAAAWGQNWTL
jgi:hypothetical protein